MAHNETMETSRKGTTKVKIKGKTRIKASMADTVEIVDETTKNMATKGLDIPTILISIANSTMHVVTAQTSAMQLSETDEISLAIQTNRVQTSNPHIGRVSTSLTISLLIQHVSSSTLQQQKSTKILMHGSSIQQPMRSLRHSKRSFAIIENSQIRSELKDLLAKPNSHEAQDRSLSQTVLANGLLSKTSYTFLKAQIRSFLS